MEIVLASRNEGKIKEIKEILKDFPITLTSLNNYNNVPDDIIEDGETFLDNAMIKAKTIYNILRKPTLSEDSGLVVRALNGEPGVRSARYGSKNDEKPDPIAVNELILQMMKDVPKGDRDAFYKAVIVLIIDEENHIITEGECHGEIANHPKGSNGFGFDPIFYLPQFDKTAGEISSEQKNAISHRGKALQDLKNQLDIYFKHHKDI